MIKTWNSHQKADLQIETEKKTTPHLHFLPIKIELLKSIENQLQEKSMREELLSLLFSLNDCFDHSLGNSAIEFVEASDK